MDRDLEDPVIVDPVGMDRDLVDPVDRAQDECLVKWFQHLMGHHSDNHHQYLLSTPIL